MLGERERRSQPGRLDAVEVDEPRDAMALRTLHDEVLRTAPRGPELGPNARVARRDRLRREPRKIAANGLDELALSRGIELVIDTVYPLNVRSESRVARQIERQVNAEATGMWDRIDEPRKGRPTGKNEVVPFGEIRRR